jgi:hypothetical protein
MTHNKFRVAIFSMLAALTLFLFISERKPIEAYAQTNVTAMLNLPNTFTAANEFTNIGNVRMAGAFGGSDWCANVVLANTDLGGTPGEIWVDQSAGTASPCVAAPVVSPNVTIRWIQPGVYPIGVGWTQTYSASPQSGGFIGVPGTQINFTGAAGWTIDGTSSAKGARNIYVENLKVYGNSAITNAVTLKKVVTSTFVNLSAGNVTGAGILCQFCLSDVFIKPRVSVNDQDWSVVPSVGIQFDWISSTSDNSNQNTVIGPVMEGITSSPGIGVYVAHAGETKVIGGTSRSNAIGFQCDSNTTIAFTNSLNDIDLEANSTNDIVDNCSGSVFYNVRATELTTIGASATNTQIINGRYNAITISSGAVGVSLNGAGYNSQNTGSITNSGTSTTKTNVFNIQTGAFDANVSNNSTIVASLPSASANKGATMIVTDSTSISAEGQACAGSSTNTALAFSNGSGWKCF